MTDTEIIKRFEWCCKADCVNCPYIHLNCRFEIARKALDLINRLNEENEGLTAELEEERKNFSTLMSLYKQAKSEAYKECIDKVSKIITEFYNKHIFGDNDLEAEEKDAIINFSDDVTYALDNLLKEMGCED